MSASHLWPEDAAFLPLGVRQKFAWLPLGWISRLYSHDFSVTDGLLRTLEESLPSDSISFWVLQGTERGNRAREPSEGTERGNHAGTKGNMVKATGRGLQPDRSAPVGVGGIGRPHSFIEFHSSRWWEVDFVTIQSTPF